jgi:hypothetical protein
VLGVRKSVNMKGKGDNVNLENLAEKHKVSIEQIKAEYKKGLEVEKEHTEDPEIASQIAIDHLTESPEYYSKLSEMEANFEKAICYDKRLKNMEERKSGKGMLFIESELRSVGKAALKRLANGQVEYDRDYRLQGKCNFQGLNISIENKKGTYRQGTDINGKPWKTLMAYDYGRITGSKAVDGEAVDVYVGPNKECKRVFVVHQVDPYKNHMYDEDKVMLGFNTREQAIAAYQSQYDRPDFLGEISEFDIKDFKIALREKYGKMLYNSPILLKKSLESWKKKLLSVLEDEELEKSIIFIKNGRLYKSRGYAPGTIREWKGKKYKKLSSGKWVLTYEGTGSRGEKQAIRNVANKINSAKTMEELANIVKDNMARFRDPDGKPLPIVRDFMAQARSTGAGAKVKKEEIKEEPAKKKLEELKKDITTAEPKTEAETTGLGKIKQKYSSSKQKSGDEDEIYIGKDGLTGVWKLVEADAPSASHNEKTFHKTEGFPTNADGSTINDRDYEKDNQAQMSVISIAGDFDGRALHFDTPVVVTEDGVVISGNNRTMSSKLAAKAGTDKKYIEALQKRAKKFGFSPDDIKKFKNPRVVFEVSNKEAYSTDQFARFNEQTTKTMSPVEAAVKVSKTMKQGTIDGVSDIIADFETIGDLYNNRKGVTEVFNVLQKGGIINEFTRNQYIADDGITGAGKEFLETVMIGTVVNEANIRSLSKDGNKSVRRKLMRAITGLVQNKGMKGYAITDELNDSIGIIMEVNSNKDKFPSVEEFSRQPDMFREFNPVSIELAKKLEDTEKNFAEFMNKMNANLSIGANGQADLFFGGVETKEDIVNRILGLKKSIYNILKRFKK